MYCKICERDIEGEAYIINGDAYHKECKDDEHHEIKKEFRDLFGHLACRDINLYDKLIDSPLQFENIKKKIDRKYCIVIDDWAEGICSYGNDVSVQNLFVWMDKWCEPGTKIMGIFIDGKPIDFHQTIRTDMLIPEKNEHDLPLPRFEVHFDTNGPTDYKDQWLYSMCYEHFLGHMERICLEQCGTSGGNHDHGSIKEARFAFRMGAHIMHNHSHFGLPTYIYMPDGNIYLLPEGYDIDGEEGRDEFLRRSKLVVSASNQSILRK